MTEDQIRDVIARLKRFRLADLVDRFERHDRSLDADDFYVKLSDVEALELAERPQPQEAPTLLCETCGHAHYFQADEAGFDNAEAIPWGKCKTCDCQEPSYTTKPLGSPTP